MDKLGNKVKLVTFVTFLCLFFLFFVSIAHCSNSRNSRNSRNRNSNRNINGDKSETLSSYWSLYHRNLTSLKVQSPPLHLHRDARRLSPLILRAATSSEEADAELDADPDLDPEDDEQDEEDENKLSLNSKKRKKKKLIRYKSSKDRERERERDRAKSKLNKSNENDTREKIDKVLPALFKSDKGKGSEPDYNLAALTLQNDKLVKQLLENDRKSGKKKLGFMDIRGLGLPYPDTDTDSMDTVSTVGSYVNPLHLHRHHSQHHRDHRDHRIEYAMDPAHPLVLAHTQHNPLVPFKTNYQAALLNHPGLPKKPLPKKKKKKELSTGTLLPLDKTAVHVGFVFSWVFWTVVAVVYYYWGAKYGKDAEKEGQVARPIIVSVQPGQAPQYFQTRALNSGSNFSWTRVLDMIAMAQETYEKFDFQSLDCQKKALCELQQKHTDFGETGRKISSSFSFMDALDGLPMPTMIQTYLKEYKEAILQGKNSTKDCAAVYPKCQFSIKEIFVKYTKKSHKL